MEVVKLIFFAFVALFILVTIHEYGHYWVARRCGVKVLRFSIGFGPILFRKQIGETEFAFSALPLGGYVKMFGEGTQEPEEEISVAEEKYSFSHKSVWQRMAIVLAGPIANFILAIVVFTLVYLGGTRGIAPMVGELEADSVAASSGLVEGAIILAVDGENTDTWSAVVEQLMRRIGDTGEIQIDWAPTDNSPIQTNYLPIESWQSDAAVPDMLGSLGLRVFASGYEPTITEVAPDSAAESADLKAGDIILGIEGYLLEDPNDWTGVIQRSPGETLRLNVRRESEDLSIPVVPALEMVDSEEIGRIGVAWHPSPFWDESLKRDRSYGLFSAFTTGVSKTWDSSIFVLSMIKKLVTGQVSVKSLGGPISIAKIAGDSADQGWQTFFQFIAMMSVMLAVMNLLPIPVLDGGHFLFYLVEAVKGSPLSEAVQGVAMRLGMAAVLGIMLLAVYLDISRHVFGTLQ